MAHDLLTVIVFGFCGNDHPEAEVENHGYNVAQGPMFKFGAECCGRTGHEDIENTPCECMSALDILIAIEEGTFYDESSSFDGFVHFHQRAGDAGQDTFFDDTHDPSETFTSRAGNRKRRRLRRPDSSHIAAWMIGDVASQTMQKANPFWVNPKQMLHVYVTP